MVEDITTGLARVRWLSVIGSRSSLSARQRHSDLRDLGRELGADYILHGSFRREGRRIRISTHLCETAGLREVWAQRYDREMGDVFELQDEIASSVVGAIEPSLREAEIERIRRKRPQDLNAYDLVLRALPFVYKLMPQACAPALPLLEAALRLEPEYGLAHAALAWCHHVMFSRGGLDPQQRAASLHHANAAIRLGGDDALCLSIGAFVTWFDAHDTRTAFDLFDRALAISPSNVLALAASSVALAWSGEAALAAQRAERALHLSPFDPLRYLAYLGLSGAKFQSAQYDEARDAARQAAELNPGFSVPYAYLCAALCRLRDDDGARAAARQLLRLDPAFKISRYRVTVGLNPDVFEKFAAAWLEAGLPP
jgi:adenylate cyclase